MSPPADAENAYCVPPGGRGQRSPVEVDEGPLPPVDQTATCLTSNFTV